jgi:hypothetical protein
MAKNGSFFARLIIAGLRENFMNNGARRSPKLRGLFLSLWPCTPFINIKRLG